MKSASAVESKRSHGVMGLPSMVAKQVKSQVGQKIKEANQELFMDVDGFNQIMGPLCQAFKQVKDNSLEYMLDMEEDYEENLGFQTPLAAAKLNKQEESKALRNYTDFLPETQLFPNTHPDVQMSILSIILLDVVMQSCKSKPKLQFPPPRHLQVLLDPNNINKLVQLLVTEDLIFAEKLINFITEHFNTQYYLCFFKKTGIVPFLLNFLDTNIALPALGLLN